VRPAVNHFATPDFWYHSRALPDAVRELADKNFELLRTDSRHPSLRFRRVGAFWSARVGLHYRALARERTEGFVWFWVGDHDEYERLLRS
jgi:hypothetical protein